MNQEHPVTISLVPWSDGQARFNIVYAAHVCGKDAHLFMPKDKRVICNVEYPNGSMVREHWSYNDIKTIVHHVEWTLPEISRLSQGLRSGTCDAWGDVAPHRRRFFFLSNIVASLIGALALYLAIKFGKI
jgi:hypothetical protein